MKEKIKGKTKKDGMFPSKEKDRVCLGRFWQIREGGDSIHQTCFGRLEPNGIPSTV
jgi:hypothetical protein